MTPGQAANVEIRVAESLLAPTRIRAHVLGEEQHRRAHLLGHACDLGGDVTTPHHERAAERFQRRVQIAQRIEEKRDAIRRAERREHGVVEDEQRHDALALLAGPCRAGLSRMRRSRVNKTIPARIGPSYPRR